MKYFRQEPNEKKNLFKLQYEPNITHTHTMNRLTDNDAYTTKKN